MENLQNFTMAPEAPGVYFETRCKNNSCARNNKKLYLFIGTNMNFDFFEEQEKCLCGTCDKKSLSICNIAFYSCKWNYQGELEAEGVCTGITNYTLGYEVCQDIKNKRWMWLQFKVESLKVEETDKLKKFINSSFNFDMDLSNLKCVPDQSVHRFTEKTKENLKKEVERKRDIVYYLKKNLKDQQKVIKKLSKKLRCSSLD